MGVAFSLQLLDSASDWNGVEMGGQIVLPLSLSSSYYYYKI